MKSSFISLLFCFFISKFSGFQFQQTFIPKITGKNLRMTSDDLIPFKASQVDPVVTEKTPEHVACVYEKMESSEALHRSEQFLNLMNKRRSIRFFCKDSFPEEILLNCIETAGTAPSGAHQQPWHYSIVKSDDLKKEIRKIVELEEQLNYDERMKRSWVNDVTPLLNNTELFANGVVKKPYLEEAPYIVVVFEQIYGINKKTNEKFDHYYSKQSVGISVGLFLSALTNVGLFTLPSTPLNAEVDIRNLLKRPSNERVYLLMPVGFPAKDATVPYRSKNGTPLRKDINEICSFY